MQNDREKTYQRSSPWRKEYHQEWISYGGFGVMQSNLNPHKTGRFFSYNIVYVIFIVVCNSIIDKKKLEHNLYVMIVYIYVLWIQILWRTNLVILSLIASVFFSSYCILLLFFYLFILFLWFDPPSSSDFLVLRPAHTSSNSFVLRLYVHPFSMYKFMQLQRNTKNA